MKLFAQTHKKESVGEEAQVQEQQCGFLQVVEQWIRTLPSQLLSGSWELEDPVFMRFVDFEKAYDCFLFLLNSFFVQLQYSGPWNSPSQQINYRFILN